MSLSRAIVTAGLLVSALLAWPEAAPGELSTIALTGNPTGDPAPLGGAFSSFFSDPIVNGQGTVLFRANITGSTSQYGIYVQQGGLRTKVVRQGETADQTGGAFYTFTPPPVMNAAGQVSFSSTFKVGSNYSDGIFFWNGADPPTAIAVTGTAAPPSRIAGGTLNLSGVQPAMAGSYVVFGAGIANSLSREGVIEWPGSNPLSAIARHGDLIQGEGIGKFSAPDPASMFGRPAVNVLGQAAFTSSVTDTNSNSGVFLNASGVIAMENRAAPGTAGLFSYFYAPVINSTGDVAFVATVKTGGINADAVYATRQGTLTLVTKKGDAAPGTSGQFDNFLHGKVVLNDAGQIVYHASYVAGGQTADGVFRAEADATETPIALTGQSVPGVGTYTGFDLYPDMNNRGQVVFSATVSTQAGNKRGLFLSDGVDTVVVAMADQQVAPGFNAWSMDFAGRSDVNRGGRSALNDSGQVAVQVGTPGTLAGIFLFTPDLSWRHDSQGAWHDGAWEQTQYWTFGFQPGPLYPVNLRPAQPVTITGPVAPVTVKSLELSDACGGSPHLLLGGGGTLTVSGDATVKQGGKVTLAPGSGLNVLGQLKTDGGEFVYNGGNLSVSDNAIRVTGGVVRLNADLGSSAAYPMEVRAANDAHVEFGATQHLAALTLDGASTAAVTAGGAKVLMTKALSVAGDAAPTATLDLKDGNLVVDYTGGASPLLQVRDWVKHGANFDPASGEMFWNGTGITSSAAAADPDGWSHQLVALGVRQAVDAGDYHMNPMTSVGGEDVNDQSVVVKYTWMGDANLDGKVTLDDYYVLDFYFTYGVSVPGTEGWWTGDFNGDGLINIDDYYLLDIGFTYQGAPMGGASTLDAAPEPATLLIAVIGGAAVLAGRRGRRNARG